MKAKSKFCEIMKNFTIKSLNLLNKEKDSLHFRLDEEIVIENLSESSMSMSSKFIQKPDFVIFVYDLWNKIKELEEYKKCVEYMNKDEVIRKHLNKIVGTHEAKVRVDIDSTLQKFLLNIIHEQNDLRFRKKVFLKHFERMVDFFNKSKLKFYAFAPLEGFSSEVDEIELDKNLRITRLSKEKLSELFKVGRDVSISQDRIFRFRFILACEYETSKIIGEENSKPKILPSQEIKKTFDNVISALRLFKKGVVGYNFIQIKPLGWYPMSTSTTSGIFTYPYFGHYKLEKHEIEDFKILLKKIEKAPDFLTIPINRFNFANDRERPEDKLIDYIIAFESLFTKEPQELSYRLSIRVSFFMGKSYKDRKEIFTLIKKAYDLRSKIVHGMNYDKNVEVNGESIPIQDFVSRIEELLRESIKESIKSSLQFKNRDSLLKKIDEKIFKGGCY